MRFGALSVPHTVVICVRSEEPVVEQKEATACAICDDLRSWVFLEWAHTKGVVQQLVSLQKGA